LERADQKKGGSKIKNTESQTGYESKGCPQSKNFRATGKILLDSELFIGV